MISTKQLTLFFLLLTFSLSLSITVKGQHTLTDSDVVVIDGLIESCSYDYDSRDLIIPEVLDGQTVIGIADKMPPERGVFKNKKITSVQFPSTIEKIGDYAFYDNRFDSLKFPASVKSIGNNAFSESFNLVSIDMSECVNLETIKDWAFYDCILDSLDLGKCTSLTSIGLKAFNDNVLASLDLPSSIVRIEKQAFSTNFISSIDLTACTALTFIGDHAFNGNLLTSFIIPLPEIPGYSFNNWLMGGNTFAGGATVSSFATSYTAQLNATGFLLTFTINDGNNPIEGATVELGKYGKKTSSDMGEAIFLSVDSATDISYSISANGYSGTTGTVTVIDTAVAETLTLTLISFNVNFTVDDGSNPIEGASIALEGYDSKQTSNTGLAVFEEVIPAKDIIYSIVAEGYDTINGSVTVDNSEINVTLTLNLISYSIDFTVTDGANPISGATVTLAGYNTQVTDGAGLAVFTGVVPAADIAYSVDADEYETVLGTISVVDTDLAENISMNKTVGVSGLLENQLIIYPNPAKNFIHVQIAEDARISILNMDGKVEVQQTIEKGHEMVALPELISGLYIIRIETGNACLIKKLIIE